MIRRAAVNTTRRWSATSMPQCYHASSRKEEIRPDAVRLQLTFLRAQSMRIISCHTLGGYN